MSKIRNKNLIGFTLIEILVAVGVFGVVAVIISGIFLNINNLQKNTASYQRLQNEGRYIFDKLAREIRSRELILPEPLANPLSYLDFETNEVGEALTISLVQEARPVPPGWPNIGSLKYDLNGESDYLNAVDVSVEEARFFVWPESNYRWNQEPAANIQPRVTIFLKLKNAGVAEKYRHEIDLQTTISSRFYKR